MPSTMRHPGPRGSMLWKWTLVFSVLVMGVTAAGCRGDARLAVNPVRGRVTYNGQGVPKAVVIFFPQDAASDQGKKMRPFAYADEQGNFSLKTYVDGDGAPPGKYRVSIVAHGGTAASRGKDAPAGAAPTSGPSVAIPENISKKYGSADTSGLEVTIQNGENNLPPFELK